MPWEPPHVVIREKGGKINGVILGQQLRQLIQSIDSGEYPKDRNLANDVEALFNAFEKGNGPVPNKVETLGVIRTAYLADKGIDATELSIADVSDYQKLKSKFESIVTKHAKDHGYEYKTSLLSAARDLADAMKGLVDSLKSVSIETARVGTPITLHEAAQPITETIHTVVKLPDMTLSLPLESVTEEVVDIAKKSVQGPLTEDEYNDAMDKGAGINKNLDGMLKAKSKAEIIPHAAALKGIILQAKNLSPAQCAQLAKTLDPTYFPLVAKIERIDNDDDKKKFLDALGKDFDNLEKDLGKKLDGKTPIRAQIKPIRPSNLPEHHGKLIDAAKEMVKAMDGMRQALEPTTVTPHSDTKKPPILAKVGPVKKIDPTRNKGLLDAAKALADAVQGMVNELHKPSKQMVAGNVVQALATPLNLEEAEKLVQHIVELPLSKPTLLTEADDKKALELAKKLNVLAGKIMEAENPEIRLKFLLEARNAAKEVKKLDPQVAHAVVHELIPAYKQAHLAKSDATPQEIKKLIGLDLNEMAKATLVKSKDRHIIFSPHKPGIFQMENGKPAKVLIDQYATQNFFKNNMVSAINMTEKELTDPNEIKKFLNEGVRQTSSSGQEFIVSKKDGIPKAICLEKDAVKVEKETEDQHQQRMMTTMIEMVSFVLANDTECHLSFNGSNDNAASIGKYQVAAGYLFAKFLQEKHGLQLDALDIKDEQGKRIAYEDIKPPQIRQEAEKYFNALKETKFMKEIQVQPFYKHAMDHRDQLRPGASLS